MDWISVKEKLPEFEPGTYSSKDVLAWSGTKMFVASRWTFAPATCFKNPETYFKSTICTCCDGVEYEKITHWAELPEPPEVNKGVD